MRRWRGASAPASSVLPRIRLDVRLLASHPTPSRPEPRSARLAGSGTGSGQLNLGGASERSDYRHLQVCREVRVELLLAAVGEALEFTAVGTGIENREGVRCITNTLWLCCLWLNRTRRIVVQAEIWNFGI